MHLTAPSNPQNAPAPLTLPMPTDPETQWGLSTYVMLSGLAINLAHDNPRYPEQPTANRSAAMEAALNGAAEVRDWYARHRDVVPTDVGVHVQTVLDGLREISDFLRPSLDVDSVDVSPIYGPVGATPRALQRVAAATDTVSEILESE